MTIDFLATERHFIDHLAPVWKALPEPGRFIVPEQYKAHLVERFGISPADDLAGPDPILVASWGDLKRSLEAGRTEIARMEHGIGQSYGTDNPSYAGGRGAEAVSLFLTPNQTSADRWHAAYPDAQVAVVGSPKLDHLPVFDDSLRAIAPIAVSFHWDCRIIPETRTCMWDYGDEVHELSRQRRVIGHVHPRMEGGGGRWFRNHQIEYVRDLAEVMARAALYVCDNSSSIYEFAATGRPVVVLNRPGSRGDPGYRKDVEHGLRFWEAANVGVQVDRPRDLAAAVELGLEDAPEQRAAREAALDIVYAFRDGHSAERAAAALTAWARTRELVAA